MRLGFFSEAVTLIIVIALVSFFVFDEEPILDFSDWNALHVWLLALSLFVVFFELTLRSRFGQFVYKDLASLVALFSFWFGLENYVRLLLLIFSAHALTPLEIELLELVEVYQYMSSWFVTQVLSPVLCFSVLYFMLYFKNSTIAHVQTRVSLYLIYTITLGLLFIFFLTGWDFLMSSFSSLSSWLQNEVFYLQPKTALTYDRGLLINDQFEWHRERTWPFSLHFEDLYFFFFQLLFAWNLACCLIFFFYLGLVLVGGLLPAVSYTQLSIAFLFFEHTLVLVGLIAINFVICGFRIWLRTPLEFLI
jgi:hypothetical protein